MDNPTVRGFEYCLVCLSILCKVKTSKGLPIPFVKAKSKTDMIYQYTLYYLLKKIKKVEFLYDRNCYTKLNV